jgi:hypothetical protein
VLAAAWGPQRCSKFAEKGPVLTNKAEFPLTSFHLSTYRVEVCDAMAQGGPYSASTNFSHTLVGTLSIRRLLRTVGYQNILQALLLALSE